jgi:hypothetical protein
MSIGAIIDTATLTSDREFDTGFVRRPDGATGLWRTTMMNGARALGSNREEEGYSANSVGYNPFGVQNGVRDIPGQPAASAGADALDLPYVSGAITSADSFNVHARGQDQCAARIPACSTQPGDRCECQSTRKSYPQYDSVLRTTISPHTGKIVKRGFAVWPVVNAMPILPTGTNCSAPNPQYLAGLRQTEWPSTWHG